MRSSFYKTLLLLSLLNASGASLPFALAQTENSASASTNNAASPTMAQIRQMIDRGHPEEALKSLDTLRGQHPAPAGVDRLRGLAFYAQNRFTDANTAFAAALQADPRDQEATQMLGLTLFRLGK